MLHIRFGITYDPVNKVDKKFGLIDQFNIEGIFRHDIDITDPVIEIAGDYFKGDKNFLIYCNYMYIQELDRFYFIQEVESVRDKLWRVKGHVDVLMSFKNAILDLEAIISKQAGSEYSSKNFNDGSYMTLEENFTEVSEFPTGLNNAGEFILMTAGRIQTSSGGGGSSEF